MNEPWCNSYKWDIQIGSKLLMLILLKYEIVLLTFFELYISHIYKHKTTFQGYFKDKLDKIKG